MLSLALSLASAFSPLAEAAQAPALLLAKNYGQSANSVDISRYWVSEKLDGVRAYWDGERFVTRGGQPIHAPQWFVDGLPKQALDGELWMGRGRFERLSATVRRVRPDDAAWREVRFMVYEAPGVAGTFSERIFAIREQVAQAHSNNSAWLEAVEQFRVSDAPALQEHLQRIARAGGEGLMLHRADALYETGRSDSLLKLKLWQDAEATVIAHLPGRGKHQGRLGALRVRAADGREFSLGTGFSDQQRQHPPAVGSVITYRYNDLTAKGQPRFARFWRGREHFFEGAAEQ
jgi:DNA ligase-1